MIMMNHLLTGAVIALTVKQPELMIPLAYASHFVLDSVPHYGEGKNGDEYSKNSLSWTMITIDALVSGTFLFWLVNTHHYMLLLGALLAYMPDATWIYRFMHYRVTKRRTGRNRMSRFHERLQREYSWAYGLEFAYMIIALSTLFAELQHI